MLPLVTMMNLTLNPTDNSKYQCTDFYFFVSLCLPTKQAAKKNRDKKKSVRDSLKWGTETRIALGFAPCWTGCGRRQSASPSSSAFGRPTLQSAAATATTQQTITEVTWECVNKLFQRPTCVRVCETSASTESRVSFFLLKTILRNEKQKP